jgi:hypothetical protein
VSEWASTTALDGRGDRRLEVALEAVKDVGAAGRALERLETRGGRRRAGSNETVGQAIPAWLWRRVVVSGEARVADKVVVEGLQEAASGQ